MNIKKKKITIRFYEELNDFLPAGKRKKRISHNFIDRTSIKDLIESLGVPHTEVDLILVNGKSVSFQYLIKDKDYISVYPVFESFDIAGLQKLRPKPLRHPRFICDVHLGKLARDLRMLGFDVYYKNNLTDNEIVKLSLKERRAILTRDLGILRRSEVSHGYFVRNTHPQKQIKEIIDRFQLDEQIKPFTRCLVCGSRLVNIPRKRALEKVPEKVRLQQNKFYFCKSCDKIYWRGSHFQKMNSIIRPLLKTNN